MLPPITLPSAPVNLECADAPESPAPCGITSVTHSEVSATTSSVVDSVSLQPASQQVVTLLTSGPSSSGCSSHSSSTLRKETEQEPAAKTKKPDQQPTCMVQPIKPMQSSRRNADIPQLQTPFRVSPQPTVSGRASSETSSGTSSQRSSERSRPQGMPRPSSSKVPVAVPQRDPITSSGSNRSIVLKKRVRETSDDGKSVPEGRLYQSNTLETLFRQIGSSNSKQVYL